MDSIDEIDDKKQRRTMLENMQRSSALFQSRMQKAQGKSPDEAVQQKQAPPEQTESTDFSSEFTNQDANLNSGGQSSVAIDWDQLIEDDAWLNEEEEEDDGEDEGGGDQERGDLEKEPDEEPEEEPSPNAEAFRDGEWQPPVAPGGSPQAPLIRSALPTGGKAALPAAEAKAKSVPLDLDGTKASPTPASVATPAPAAERVSQPAAVATPPPAPEGLGSVLSERARPVPIRTLPPRGQLQKVDQAIVRAARLLVATSEEEPGYEECIRLLSRFGLGALRLCNKAKIKIHILDQDDFACFPELLEMGLDPEEFPVDGAYLIGSKLCLVDRRSLLEKPRFFHPVLYYFAHALDHAQGGEGFSSHKSAAVLACYEALSVGHDGTDFVDELAAADPVRYFARSVSIYLGRDDCDDPIWTHQDLYDFDRAMYDYLSYLFMRFSS